MLLKKSGVWIIGVVVLAVAVRWWGLGQIMTVDEERWILRSSDYYENIFEEKDLGGAFQTTHPGATAMWLMGAGVIWQEQALGYEADEANIADFQRAAKIPIAIATSFLIGLIVWGLKGLVSGRVAIGAGIFLTLEPYLVGMSQIAHLDALLGFLMVLSTVWFLRGVWRWRQGGMLQLPVKELIIAGVATGLAMGVKALPVVWLGVWWIAVLIVEMLYLSGSFRRRLERVLRIWFFTAGVAAVSFYVIWPSLWVSADLGRSLVRDYEQVVTDEHIELEESEEPIAPVTFYGRSLLGRLTPFTQVLVVVCVGWLIWKRSKIRHDQKMATLGWLVLFAVGYVVMISLAAKKGDRYAMPAIAGLVLVAGCTLVLMVEGMNVKWRAGNKLMVGVIIGGGLLIHLGLWQPHAIAYNNPLFPNVRPRPQQGWGEGLEMAAAWLNERPFIDRLSVASWYPSVMSVFFEGRTFSLSSREDHRVGYVVLYRNMEGRPEDDIASNVLDEFESQEPEQVFSLRGVPYVWIYNVLGPYYFRSHVDEITSQVEVGQLVPVERDNWRRIDLAFATFSGRSNTEDVIVEIKEQPDSDEVVRRVSVNAAVLQDEAWQTFDFEPISDSAGKTYYVSVTSPKAVPGNAVTVRFAPEDVVPGQAVVRRQTLKPGEKQSQFAREGDLGYRIFY